MFSRDNPYRARGTKASKGLKRRMEAFVRAYGGRLFVTEEGILVHQFPKKKLKGTGTNAH